MERFFDLMLLLGKYDSCFKCCLFHICIFAYMDSFYEYYMKVMREIPVKTSSAKVIIWVLIVPLSWFFVQFVLSLSSILSVSALTLPYDTFASYRSQTSSFNIPSSCVFDLTPKDWWTKTWEDTKADSWNKSWEDTKTDWWSESWFEIFLINFLW